MPARTTSNSEADSSQALRRSGPFDVPVLQVTAALLMGIVLREYVDVPGWLFPVASVLVLLAASVLVYRRCHWGARFTIIVLFLLIGAIRWQIREDSGQHSALLHLRQQDDTPVSLTARIDSVPVVHDRPESSLSQRSFGSRQQTRFLVSAISVDVPGQVMPIEGHCQVYVDGDASNACHSGDVVRLLGHTGWPDAPGNPGEFDFPTYLRRKGISALLYVKHPHAIAIVESGGWSSPGYWLTVLRSQARTSIVRHVDPEVRSIAMALLLGDRNELTDETEQAFISSGAMHLLAISGLHVGIMWLFAMRFLNLLFVPRNRALVIVAVLCIVYAMMTDLRPSVVRATVFFVLITIAELSRRNVRMVSVLATAAFLMLLWQPWLAFNSGAWLSFLSVAALCCIDAGRMNTDRDRAAPSDSITVKEKLLRYRDVLWDSFSLRMRQMLMILLLTIPVIALEFNIVSPVVLLTNVLLILLTAVILELGFVLLFAGLVWPQAGALPGLAFSWGLKTLESIVRWASDVQLGHAYIPDIPAEAVLVYFVLLLMFALVRRKVVRRVVVAMIVVLLTTAAIVTRDPQPAVLCCTVLDVGHGSSAVIEFPDGRVLVVDAGAMNRGDRAAETICRFLWAKGYRHIDSLLVSHADADHFNALGGILRRVPVGQVIVGQDFLKSDEASPLAVIEACQQYDVSVAMGVSGDSFSSCGGTVRILQAGRSSTFEEMSDNERSLVVLVDYAGRRICLPGDLEGTGLNEVLPSLPTVDVLISPHHGAANGNTPILAEQLLPDTVIVSSRDDLGRQRLQQTYADSEELLFTSVAGAVTLTVDSGGLLNVSGFRSAAAR